jgi:phosphoadenosine phosphosulfate reductase
MAYDHDPLTLAESLDGALREAAPEAVIEAALGRFGRKLALVSSFGAESAVLLHMAAQVDPKIAVLFLDTGHLFAQTLDYRQNLARQLGLLNVRDLRPAFADLVTGDPAADLWRKDPDGCCAIRKVRPLDQALRGFDAWITGRKRFQSQGRASLKVVEAAAGGLLKFNPLAGVTAAELDAYRERHALPPHPLTAAGYPSIGCWPCTRPVEDGESQRAGRWAGLEKTECGIHRPEGRGGAAGDVGGGI